MAHSAAAEHAFVNGSDWIELEMESEELRRAQLDLQEARARYARLYELAPVAHLTLDATGTAREANRLAGLLLGVSRERLIGRGFQEFVAPGQIEVWASHLRQVFATDGPETCDLRLLTGDGAVRAVRLRSARTGDASEVTPCCWTTLVDVTEPAELERALGESRARLEGVIASAMDAIVGLSEDERIVFFNPAAEAMFGCPARHAVGQPLDRFLPVHDLGRAFGAVDVTRRVTRAVGILTARRSDETEFPVEASVSRVDAGERRLFTVSLRDVSERERAAEALRQSEARYRTIVETQTELVCRFLPDTTLTFVNEAYGRYFGQTAAALIGQSFLPLIPEGERDAVRARIASQVAARKGSTHEHAVIAADGAVAWQEWTDRPIVDGQGRVVEFQSVGRDVTERKQAEQALRRTQEQLRGLTAQLIRAEEEGRRRLAADLHDDIGQRLAALCVEVDLLLQRPPAALESALQHVRDCYGRLVTITDDVQQLARALHPAILRDLGLPAALRAHLTEFEQQPGARATWRERGAFGAVRPDFALCLYRVAQEALHNVAKHAGPSRVTVTLAATRRGIGLCVADTGRGFDPRSVGTSGIGLGLVSMRERVGALGGGLRVRTRPGNGTHVHAWLPLTAGPR